MGPGPLQKGTHRFYRVATTYVLRKGLWVTLAVYFVLPEKDTLQVWKALIDQLDSLGMQIEALYLYKGFYGINELRELDKRQLPAVVVCTIRGKRGGTQRLCRGNQSYPTEYAFHGGMVSRSRLAWLSAECLRPISVPRADLHPGRS